MYSFVNIHETRNRLSKVLHHRRLGGQLPPQTCFTRTISSDFRSNLIEFGQFLPDFWANLFGYSDNSSKRLTQPLGI